MKSLDDLARFIVSERLQLRAGCERGKWWARLERAEWTHGSATADTLGAALDGAVEDYMRGIALARSGERV